MERIRCCSILIATMIAVLAVSTIPASGQITTACTSSLISSFTPCFNYLTGSTNGGGSPTGECCSALGSIISSSAECTCLIVTGNVPLSLPINRALAISLPRLCKSKSVPLQCQATATPLPGPGPVTYGPSLPPLPSTGLDSGSDVNAISPSLVMSPPIPTFEPATPPAVSGPLNQGQRPLVLPSSAVRLKHRRTLPMLLLLLVGLGSMLLS